MKVAVSYFAQLRNFTRNMIPVSTAVWDPKWYHDGSTQDHIFYDKRGILNGVRCTPMAPNPRLAQLCGGHNCTQKDNGTQCDFLKGYAEQLSCIPFENMKKYLDNFAKWVDENYDIPSKDVILVFMVYEKYDNPCSERNAILEYFRNNGMPIEELRYPIKDNY